MLAAVRDDRGGGSSCRMPRSPMPPRAGDRDAVKSLLKDGADVNAPQGDGMTALHWAAERGDPELTEYPDLRRRQRLRP